MSWEAAIQMEAHTIAMRCLCSEPINKMLTSYRDFDPLHQFVHLRGFNFPREILMSMLTVHFPEHGK